MLSVIVPLYRNVNLVEYCLCTLSENFPSDADLILDCASGPETVQVQRRSNTRECHAAVLCFERVGGSVPVMHLENTTRDGGINFL